MSDYKIGGVSLEGNECYFYLLRDDGVDGEVQVNMKVIIDSYLIDDIEWEDE